jgi:flavin-dependent dehydrogenase
MGLPGGELTHNFDVVIVGGRCAGSPLAALLARRGLQVCVVDRARFPSEVPSTHMIHPSGVARLHGLGLADELVKTGAPPLVRGFFRVDDVRLDFGPSVASRFEAPWLCVRRSVLDGMLLDAAREAGAEVRTQTAVTGLVEQGGDVQGVLADNGPIRAGVVVGADGPSSVVARLAGAHEYHATPPGRFFVWAYYEQAANPPGEASLGRVGDVGFLSMPTDGGLFMAGVALPMADRNWFVPDLETSFNRSIASVEPLADILASARRVGPIRTMIRWHGYFRSAAGPGWALVGDAGHFKDPTPAQGISDALRQSERLATAIETGLGTGTLQDELTRWWHWRDQDAWEMYWMATDMGAATSRRLVTEMLRGLSHESDGTERFLRVLNHEIAPSKVFNATRALRTLAKVAARTPRALPELVSDARQVATDTVRRERARRNLAKSPPISG